MKRVVVCYNFLRRRGSSNTEVALIAFFGFLIGVSILFFFTDNIRGLFSAAENGLAGDEHCQPTTRPAHAWNRPARTNLALALHALGAAESGKNLASFGNKNHQVTTSGKLVEHRYADGPALPAADSGYWCIAASLSGEECESTVRYVAVDGELFIQGQGDAHPVSPDDVSQGQAPDCYLIAALTGLADKAPHLIERMFSESSTGAFAVTLYRHNQEHELTPERFHLNKMIVVDGDGRGLFARDGDSRLPEGETSPNPQQGQYELWVKMAETAWAGMQDGWSYITEEYTHTGLEALTGKYADVEFAYQNHPINPKVQTMVAELAKHRQAVLRTGFLDVDELERRLAAGQIVVAGTIDQSFPNAQREKTFQTDRLALAHAYYVMSADVAGDRIVVQNPHGWDGEGIVLTTEEFQSSFCQTAAIDPGR